MDTKRTIRKILVISIWLIVAGGMVTLLAAAIKNQRGERCSDYIISIKGTSEKLFVDKPSVIRTLKTATQGDLKGASRSSFDLRKLEQLLEENLWIKDAELYFDNRDVLHVTISEREPIARVFTSTGKTFYIDESEKQLPVSEKTTARVPVFTGFPVKKVVSKKDKDLLHDIKMMASFISADPFWTSQVAQVDINADNEFELIPLVGNHTVRFGKADAIENKFHRLFIFYKNVLAVSGFDKYKTIDVKYAGQVIGVRGNESRVDSVQLRRSIEKLLQQARNISNEATLPPIVNTPVTTETAEDANDVAATTLNKPALPDQTTTQNPNPVKPSLKPVPVKKTPKAVMPKQQQ